MRQLFLFLVAASASAAGIDISAPGFWNKSYAIPHTYCERHIRVEAERPEKLVEAAAPCAFSVIGGGLISDCTLSREESDRVVAELRRLGTLLEYSQNCGPAPAYEELYYKRDNLRREWAELGLSSAAAPAIGGLLEAQFSTLDQLIAAREAALQAVMSIVLSGPEAAADGDTAPYAGRFRRASSIKVAHKIGDRRALAPQARSWARRTSPVCEQLDAIIVEYETADSPEDSHRIDAARRLGEAYTDPDCARLRDAALTAAIFSTRPDTEIRRRLMGLPGLRSWRVDARSGGGNLVPDDRRFDDLSAERSALSGALSRAPHVLGLVDAEIERVRANAERLRRLRKGRLLLIRQVR